MLISRISTHQPIRTGNVVYTVFLSNFICTFQTWLYKLSGTQKQRVPLNYSGVWNKRYFILERDGNIPSLLYYSKKPKNDKAAPKGDILNIQSCVCSYVHGCTSWAIFSVIYLATFLQYLMIIIQQRLFIQSCIPLGQLFCFYFATLIIIIQS